ncbi:trehalose-6-phosphate hydrolase [Leclercia adecarboxylata]|uniref:Trehalose-6-phosphate hydrolase n=1 Tax=Leclercia adecarboxylata TaxID=83655 RepID=A0A4V6JHJ0_9ENTR|nr:trehalose-6-phosphate hydrolase [Leclercia adecarboxylata]
MNTLPHWWQNGVIYQIYPEELSGHHPGVAPATYAA